MQVAEQISIYAKFLFVFVADVRMHWINELKFMEIEIRIEYAKHAKREKTSLSIFVVHHRVGSILCCLCANPTR